MIDASFVVYYRNYIDVFHSFVLGCMCGAIISSVETVPARRMFRGTVTVDPRRRIVRVYCN